MFKYNRYAFIYASIIYKAKNRQLKSEYEIHHIIPKSVGGSNEKQNLVKLTPKEHFLCHKLLIRSLSNLDHQKKMVYALWYMSNNSRYVSKGYEQIKKTLVAVKKENIGEMNPFFGRKHSMETKLKISKNNGMHKLEIRNKTKGPRPKFIPHNQINGWSEETKLKISQSLSGKQHSDKRKQNRSDMLKKAASKWMNKDSKTKMVPAAQLEKYLADGWNLGRKYVS